MQSVECIFEGFVMDPVSNKSALKLCPTHDLQFFPPLTPDQSFEKKWKSAYQHMLYRNLTKNKSFYALPTNECKFDWNSLSPKQLIRVQLGYTNSKEKPLGKHIMLGNVLAISTIQFSDST